MASIAAGLQNAAPSAPPDNQPSEPVTQKPRKTLSWIPRLSLHLWKFHLWAGKTTSDGRNIFLLIEEDKPQISLSVHWLTDESPMFGLYLYPVIVAYAFWAHSHDITKEAA